jgi:hypothetical protein
MNWKELAHRSSHGVHVTLSWDADTDAVSVEATDVATGEAVFLVVPPAQALDAFRHPFAYAATCGRRAPSTVQAARVSASRSSRATLGR